MDVLDYTPTSLLVVSGIIALANGFVRGISRVNRLLPIFLQLGLLGLMLMPLLHGFPNEWFSLFVLTAIWSLGTVFFSFMLYKSPSRISRLLGATQFTEAVAALFTTAAGYIGSCYTYYGHFACSP